MRGRCAGKRSPVRAALGGARARSAGAACFALGLAARLDLLDFFEPEQQLIFRQRLGPAAEAVALQLLDDLSQPLGARALRKQHRLQRAGIVGKRVGHDHESIKSWAALRRERSDRA